MKTFLFLLGLCVSLPLFAQEQESAVANEPNRSPEEIEKLAAPIALYPDSLIALILPASTASSDVVLAARYLASRGDVSQIDAQPWNESVKSLVHYPTIVKWMDENLAWTQEMGGVFADQPADVMNAIQRLRAHAREAGLLTDTPQQRVLQESDGIYIVPAEPNIIYVPTYDPEILWARRSYAGSFISFGVGFGIGNWLYYDCDWPGRTIWVHRRHPNWAYSPGWRAPRPSVRVNVVREWHPDPRRVHSRTYGNHSFPEVSRRGPINTQDHRPRQDDFRGRDRPSGPRSDVNEHDRTQPPPPVRGMRTSRSPAISTPSDRSAPPPSSPPSPERLRIRNSNVNRPAPVAPQSPPPVTSAPAQQAVAPAPSPSPERLRIRNSDVNRSPAPAPAPAPADQSTTPSDNNRGNDNNPPRHFRGGR